MKQKTDYIILWQDGGFKVYWKLKGNVLNESEV